MASKPPTARLSRVARLSGLTSRVGSSYLGQRIVGAFQDEDRRQRAMERLHIDNARKIVDTMGQLKGAAMKVGQQLAQVVEGMDLPEEVAGILGQLNDAAEPIPFDLIREDIEAELDAPLAERFAKVEEAPLGTASLAQAHAAWLHDGRPVVVKVLHRGIEGSVASDLSALKALFITGRILQRDRDEIDMIFDEIRQRLQEELDYFGEAANLTFFRQRLAPHAGLRVPAVHPELSGERVLTMDRLQGLPLDAFLASAGPEARQAAGLNLARAFFLMVYELRTLHADPHAGNFLFEPDGAVGLLDFGCVKRFDEFFVADYARIAEAGIAGRRDEAIALLKRTGALCSDRTEAADALWSLVDVMAEPFRHGRYTAGGNDDSITQRVQEVGPRLLRYPEIRTPREMIYLHRALGGIYAMLRRLQVRADWGAMSRPYHAQAIARAEGRGG